MTNISPDLLREKFAGALLGTFTGDAAGAPVEGIPPELLRETLDEFATLAPRSPVRELQAAILGLISGDPIPPGSAYYTDDTQMMIGIAESLAACRGFDGPDLAHRFAENFEGSRGYGPGGYSAIRAFKAGVPWNEAGTRLFGPGGSFGNGGAMRVAPVGVFYFDDAVALRRVAEATASLTHLHPLGQEGAVLQAFAVACAVRRDAAVQLDVADYLAELHVNVRDTTGTYTKKLTEIARLLAVSPSSDEVVHVLGNDLTAHGSVPAAIYAFLRHSNDFAAAVTGAVRLGGDADTIAAMTGAIAGALLGSTAIPPAWLASLENGPKGRDYVRDLAGRLFDRRTRGGIRSGV